jgi:putative transposase
MCGRCDKLTTTVEAATSLLRSRVPLGLVSKDRGGVLGGEHLDALGEGFASVGADVGAELVELDGQDDQVQLLVASPPQVAVARLVNSRKGIAARRLRQRSRVRTYREQRWSPW